MATHSTIRAWKIPWTEEPHGLQSVGSQSLTRLSTHVRTNSVSSDSNFCSVLSMMKGIAKHTTEVIGVRLSFNPLTASKTKQKEILRVSMYIAVSPECYRVSASVSSF